MGEGSNKRFSCVFVRDEKVRVLKHDFCSKLFIIFDIKFFYEKFSCEFIDSPPFSSVRTNAANGFESLAFDNTNERFVQEYETEEKEDDFVCLLLPVLFCFGLLVALWSKSSRMAS